jgi:hypothetical protein
MEGLRGTHDVTRGSPEPSEQDAREEYNNLFAGIAVRRKKALTENRLTTI